MKLLDGASFNRLLGAIDAATLRHQVTANNIANEDTPYFKRSEVAFETLLQNQLNGQMPSLEGRRTDPRHIPIGTAASVPQAQIHTEQLTNMNNNMNNVDIDREMSLLAENQLRYNTMIQQVNHEIRMMRTAIEGRR
ncbi:flagellar basal body rod protein FlgB [Paenibacillus sp. CECT 9249]|uniref:flagellar basal body rod protein FlgB n=1 Tax=unclassified Paenibacillus TaxID=185978 RepID=UPI001C105570|nr:flagellar basal body rod protein FlgB [Paenibacillus sp. CECT 9249]MBU5441758.1 flagellar basal body rod protein FlgB [Paenibacillus sp. MSJ-34]CAH0119803.1 Flagellar basal body rod protein FlgB [Paenibacillus sp. CECT 9249]